MTEIDALLYCEKCKDIVHHIEIKPKSLKYVCQVCGRQKKVDSHFKIERHDGATWHELNMPGALDLEKNRRKGRKSDKYRKWDLSSDEYFY